MREVIEHGRRWLVVDVRGASSSGLVGTHKDVTQEQEKEIMSALVAGLKEEGIEAEIRYEVPPAPPGVFRLIVPVLRAYFPLKDASRDFYAAFVAAVFSQTLGVSHKEAVVGLSAQAIASLAARMKKLSDQELEIVQAVASLARASRGPVTNSQLNAYVGRDVEPDAVRLSGRGVLRFVNDGWVVDF